MPSASSSHELEPGRRKAAAGLASATLIEAPALRKQVYGQLRDAIVTGELPAGSRLSPPAIAAAFGVSTMPVREAIRLLEEDRLVETAPRRWTRVASPDPDLADEIYPVLAVLEEFALATGPAVPVAAIAEARRANTALAQAAAAHDVLACVAADAEFHALLVDLNPNATLRRAIADLKVMIRLLEGSFFRVDDASVSVGQHEEVVAALVRGENAAAGAAIAANWQHGLQRLREVLVEAADERDAAGQR